MCDPREAALRSLIGIYADGRYSNIETDASIKRCGFGDQDRRLYTALVMRTVEKTVTADHVISQFSSKPVGKLDRPVLAALRLGVTQILYMNGIREHAACYETVEALKKISHGGAAGYVNAVLRNVLRNRDSIRYPEKGDPRYLSVNYSVSDGIADSLTRDYGAEKAEEILRASEWKTSIAVRTNGLASGYDDERVAALAGARAVGDAPHGLMLKDGAVPAETPGFDEGMFFVQDISSQLCVAALGALPGMTVVDCCSAPGGKAFGAAIDMKNRGRVVCLDVHENKLRLVRKGADRLGITIIETAVCDGRIGIDSLDLSADRVICDVPCSGLGVIAKKPEIRLRDPVSESGLTELQSGILSRASRYVRPGGRLVYSTCTLRNEENRGMVDGFLGACGEFSLICDRTVFPGRDRDGFYYAVIERKDNP